MGDKVCDLEDLHVTNDGEEEFVNASHVSDAV